jgi:Uma2 family endonuclease
MSSIDSSIETDYPESDGRPMGETDWHIDAIIRLRDVLRRRYCDQSVYVGSDLLVYHVEGVPQEFVVPDVFVVLDCENRKRRTFKIWEEHRTPDVVFEITSKSTARQDRVFKPSTYEQIGVKELFLFDPTGDYLKPNLQGIRFQGGKQIPMELADGRLVSTVLGASVSSHNQLLKLFDLETGEEFLTGEESEREAKESEREAKESERRARDLERKARIAAEARADRLQAELERLQREKGQS